MLLGYMTGASACSFMSADLAKLSAITNLLRWIINLACKYVTWQGGHHLSFRLESLETHFGIWDPTTASSWECRHCLAALAYIQRSTPRWLRTPAIPWANPTDLELSIARLVISHALEVAPVAEEDLCRHCPMWPTGAHYLKRVLVHPEPI